MSPPAPATMSRTRMKTYFIVASSRPHLFGPGGREDLAHRGAPFRGAVHGHAEPVVGEARIERRRRPQARKAAQQDHADDGGHAPEEDRELEGDHHEGRNG